MILFPLVIGYLIPLRSARLQALINRLLSAMVYVILFLMGISLAFLDNLDANLLLILRYFVVCFVCTIGANMAALWLLGRRTPWKNAQAQTVLPSRFHLMLDSLKLCAVVLGGFLLGLTRVDGLSHATQGSEYALIFLLVLVGIQLRNSGMTLRQITLNRRGMLVALTVGVSALCGGALAAYLLRLPLNAGLAMASGYGWYSLSGILLTDAFGPVIGSAAFFNDLARELLAIVLIPALMQKDRARALGLCGATSMDFTLPVLQRSGGIDIVPAAIVHGFLLSLCAPILIAFFSS